jgi:outer membrane protein assembly factor BamB
MKNSMSILSVLIALAIVPSTGCAAVSKPKPSPVSKNKPKPGTILWEFTAEEGEKFHNSVVISKSGGIFAASATHWYALDSRTGKAKRKLKVGSHIMAMSVTADSCLLSGRGGDSRAINSDTGKQV